MLINREHTIRIAIEGGAQIRARLTYLLLHIDHVLWLDGACRVMGEVAIKLKVQRNEFAGQALEDARHHHAGHAISGINNDFEGFDLAHIDKRKRVIDVIVDDVALRHLALALWFLEVATDRQVANIGQPAILTDRIRLGATEFDAVIFSRVVRGGNHRACGIIKLANGEIETVGGCQAEVDSVHALIGNAANERGGQLRRGEAQIAAHCDLWYVEILSGGAPDGIGNLVGEVLTVDATNVICFEDRRIDGYTRSTHLDITWHLPWNCIISRGSAQLLSVFYICYAYSDLQREKAGGIFPWAGPRPHTEIYPKRSFTPCIVISRFPEVPRDRRNCGDRRSGRPRQIALWRRRGALAG